MTYRVTEADTQHHKALLIKSISSFSCKITAATPMKKAAYTRGVAERWASSATVAVSSVKCPKIATAIPSSHTRLRSSS